MPVADSAGAGARRRMIRLTIISVREKSQLGLPQYMDDIAQSVQALDTLEDGRACYIDPTPLHLVRLVKFRDSRQSYHVGHLPKRGDSLLKFGHVKARASKSSDESRRALSSALNDVILEVYPEVMEMSKKGMKTDPSVQKKFASIKKRLTYSRNWQC